MTFSAQLVYLVGPTPIPCVISIWLKKFRESQKTTNIYSSHVMQSIMLCMEVFCGELTISARLLKNCWLVFLAAVCFKESLPTIPNAQKTCSNSGQNVTCTYTCNPGYVYYDGSSSKTYQCSGENVWSPSASPENCLSKYCMNGHIVQISRVWSCRFIYLGYD